MYKRSVRLEAHKNCGDLKANAFDLCISNVEQISHVSHVRFARKLRSQDKAFLKKYAVFAKSNSAGGDKYKEKKRDLADSFQATLDAQRSKELHNAAQHEQHELKVQQEVREHLMIHQGSDLGKDYGKGQMPAPEEQMKVTGGDVA